MKKFDEFIFERYFYDQESRRLHLFYAYKDGARFEEIISFPSATRLLSPEETEALDRAFRLIFLLAGVSYYKAYVPAKLSCSAFPLDDATVSFLEEVYRNGLGEFAFRNNTNLSINFVSSPAAAPPQPIALHLPRRSLVPVGGGKDSIVTLECLKQHAEPITLFALGSSGGIAAPIAKTIEVSQQPSLVVKRTLSNTLLELNKTDALNGHVPITAILSSITIACCLMYGYDTVMLSNEHSASAPNFKINGHDVNHQYSKSLSFEACFSNFIHHYVSPDIQYFSFLRPLTEAEITRRFCSLAAYHEIFRSCNTAFRQDERTRNKNWCCDCPKCRFVFLALAPFMEKNKLISLFGSNLLDDPRQEEGFKELCGFSAHKPFECVGETDECALLMEKLSGMDAWKQDCVVRNLYAATEHRGDEDFEKKYEALFSSRHGNLLPEKYMRMINEH